MQITFITLFFLIYKTTSSDSWVDEQYTNASFGYAESEIRKKFEGAYWQVLTTTAFINNIFVNTMDSYSPISMCTIDDCFSTQS